jgi:hypothetical protein
VLLQVALFVTAPNNLGASEFPSKTIAHDDSLSSPPKRFAQIEV